MEIQTWLLEQTDQLVAASNFATSGILFIVGTLVLFYITKIKFSRDTDLFYMLVGICIEAYGWAIHRMYWGMWRVYKLYGDTKMEQWFEDHAYFSLIPIFMILVGAGLILGPAVAILANYPKRIQYFTLTFAFIFSLLWFSYWKVGDAFESFKKRQNVIAEEVITIQKPATKIIPKSELYNQID